MVLLIRIVRAVDSSRAIRYMIHAMTIKSKIIPPMKDRCRHSWSTSKPMNSRIKAFGKTYHYVLAEIPFASKPFFAARIYPRNTW